MNLLCGPADHPHSILFLFLSFAVLTDFVAIVCWGDVCYYFRRSRLLHYTCSQTGFSCIQIIAACMRRGNNVSTFSD